MSAPTSVARRLGARLSGNAFRNLDAADAAVDEAETCDPAELRDLLRRAALPVLDPVLDLEATVGGAAIDGRTYGVARRVREALAQTRDPAMRDAMLAALLVERGHHPAFAFRSGGYPLVRVRDDGRIVEERDHHLPRLQYDSLVHLIEVTALVPFAPDTHQVVVAAAAGIELAGQVGARRFAAASGRHVAAWLAPDTGETDAVGVIERHGAGDADGTGDRGDRGDADQPDVRDDADETELRSRDVEAAVAAITWAHHRDLAVRWTGPWIRPRRDQPMVVSLTWSATPWDAIEIAVWGEPGDRAIASRPVRGPWPWAR